MDRKRVLPQVDEALCTLCGLCVEACPCHAVELGERGPVFSCPVSCTGVCENCCLCEDACPTGAITWAFQIVLEAPERGQARSPS